MVETLNEVPEAEATGKIKDIYEDIKTTLRTPMVSVVFRMMATEPDYLQIAWRALKPNAQTVYFERYGDAARARAVEGLVDVNQAPSKSRAPDVVPVLQVVHYVDPKVFLGVAALRAATGGQHPKLTELSAADKRQIVTGVPPAAQEVSMQDAAGGDERATRVLDDVTRTLGVPGASSELAALARWPEYLESAWRSWKTVAGQTGYRQLERDLRRMAEEAIAGLPFRMDVAPQSLRHAGLSERQIDRVRSILQQSYSFASSMTMAFAFFTAGAVGRNEALRSPFPAEER